jgi:hypothetical protein
VRKYAVASHAVLSEHFFTYKEIFHDCSPLREKITNSIHFGFNQTVIDDFLVQLGSLIDNLEKIYTQHHEGTAVKFGKKHSVAKENPKATKMPKAIDVFEFDPDCDTDSVKHIMAEVEYHIMQHNKDEQLQQLLQVDNTTPSDVLQPDVVVEGDRKPAAIPLTKVVDRHEIKSQPDMVEEGTAVTLQEIMTFFGIQIYFML